MSDKLLVPKKFFEKMQDDHISEYAAECAYFTIFSFRFVKRKFNSCDKIFASFSNAIKKIPDLNK